VGDVNKNPRGSDNAAGKAMSRGMADILRTSCQLMATKGFHGTSMRDLAHATGRSVSGLYHHFRGKEDLLFLINYHGFTTLNDSWAQLEGRFGKPEDTLYAFIFFHTSYFVEHTDEMRVMTWGTHAMNLEKARLIQSLKNQYTESARQIIRAVCEASQENAIDAQRLERLTYLLFGMMNWTFGWYSRRRHGGVAELARDIYRTAMSGIRGDGGGVEGLAATESVVEKWLRDAREASMWANRDGVDLGDQSQSKGRPSS
jgi:AcrR family transcriptional regulator